MRFPSRLLAANMWLAAMLWAAFLVFVAAVAVGVAVFGTLTESAWEKAVQLPRWYALFVGVALVREFLPMYIAHGQTRRQFGVHAAVTVALFAPFLSALITVGYLLEAALYGLASRPQALGQAHLFTEPTQLPLVFAEYLTEFLAWIVAGTFAGAGFYRWRHGGLITIPVGIALVLLAAGASGTQLRFPFAIRLGLDLPGSLPLTLGAGLGVSLLGLALTWLVIRDMPLRNKPA
ncbi:hypothetical protein FHS43_005835 [Streptosporangium becharense]|uniref:Uncharacterized protein n=1 Tax=Streptosporangium becharense TaxID=1816182 RepID=A0A7W9IMB2_9ACTN|nr:hypothetical protein [Streptosporangium becharense]MBB2914523.1 hypothetical protein [Streptosporangium becharense]MBB5823368.1 hypothetical protein [Streptosporangium becharense]